MVLERFIRGLWANRKITKQHPGVDSGRITPDARAIDERVYDLLYTSGNYLTATHFKGDFILTVEERLKLGRSELDQALALVESFSNLSDRTKQELVTQKIRWRQELSPEEKEFGIKSNLFPRREVER